MSSTTALQKPSSSPSAASASSSSLILRKHKKSKKRPLDSGNNTKKDKDGKKQKNHNKGKAILTGMIVAVSTLQEAEKSTKAQALTTGTTSTTSSNNKNNNNNNNVETSSYRAVTEVCRAAGATISNQVHKKVNCVLCTKAAANHATQRVRKAKKNKIPLVDIAWLHQCLKAREKLPLDSYLLDYPDAKPVKKEESRKSYTSSKVGEEPQAAVESVYENWSSPVTVGCCCVCHENGDTNCSWCTDCNYKC